MHICVIIIICFPTHSVKRIKINKNNKSLSYNYKWLFWVATKELSKYRFFRQCENTRFAFFLFLFWTYFNWLINKYELSLSTLGSPVTQPGTVSYYADQSIVYLLWEIIYWAMVANISAWVRWQTKIKVMERGYRILYLVLHCAGVCGNRPEWAAYSWWGFRSWIKAAWDLIPNPGLVSLTQTLYLIVITDM